MDIAVDHHQTGDTEMTVLTAVMGADTEAGHPVERIVVDVTDEEVRVEIESQITTKSLNILRNEVGVRVTTRKIVVMAKVNINTRNINIRRTNPKSKKVIARLNRTDHVLFPFSALFC